MPSSEFLVMFNVPTSLEEAVVDALLMFDTEDGFNSFPVYAHDCNGKELSLAEQVSGRQKRIRFQLFLPETELQALLQTLRQEFKHSGIHYQVLPVVDNGYF